MTICNITFNVIHNEGKFENYFKDSNFIKLFATFWSF